MGLNQRESHVMVSICCLLCYFNRYLLILFSFHMQFCFARLFLRAFDLHIISGVVYTVMQIFTEFCAI